MALIRSQVVLQWNTGLPEDVSVNNYHFDSGTVPYEDAIEDIGISLNALYGEPGNPSTAGIWSYLTGVVNRAYTIRHYNLADPEPRPPTIQGFTLPSSAFTAARNLVTEASICVSFRGALPASPRRRGRVFLGPLNDATSNGPTGTTIPRLTTACQQDIRNTFAAFQQSLAGPWWVIRSSVPTVNYVPVVAGWVDNTFDTQRRRGVPSTSRSIWPVIP